ncbi:DinB family protein [soil metagenome]
MASNTERMSESAFTADLLHYLQRSREALLFKLEGLSEYDQRRPLVPTGTNLLGIVKHVASVEAGYLGEIFGRPFPEEFAWFAADAEPNADMWATAEESPEAIVALYRRVWVHSDATVGALPLDAVGTVPWWPHNEREVTLHRILVHMIDETQRHAGHADIVRELIDGAAGVRADNDNLPEVDREWWSGYYARLQSVAEATR